VYRSGNWFFLQSGNENADSENLTLLDVEMISEKNYALKIGNSKLLEKSREINEITSEIRVTGSVVQKQITDFFSTKV